MDFSGLIRQHKLIDIVSVDDKHYALAAQETTVAGCIVVLPNQLHNYEREFLLRGYSHKHRSAYSKNIGLEPWIIFTYELNALSATKKQTFSHALSGTGGRKGLLIAWRGQKLGRSAFILPVEYEKEATAFLNSWHAAYRTEVVLRG